MLIKTCDNFKCGKSSYVAVPEPSWITVRDFMKEYHFCSAECMKTLLEPRAVASIEMFAGEVEDDGEEESCQ